jgi:3-oxoacyl-[acyl-carrier-protein] synthase III
MPTFFQHHETSKVAIKNLDLATFLNDIRIGKYQDLVLNVRTAKSKEDIDYFVLHQANKFMLDALRKKIKVTEEQLPIMMEDCGNTVSSTIPIALFKLRQEGKLREGKKLMLIGFGVGYSWAACLVDF